MFWALCASSGTATAQISAAAPAAAPPPPLDALAIFERARATVAARAIPPFIEYTESATLIRHGKPHARHDRVIVRMADGKANITPIPDSWADRINVQPFVRERPLVYPTTTFGFVRRRSGEAPSQYEADSTPPSQPEQPLAGPVVIGRVKTNGRDYEPTLIGNEIIDGAPVYHLALAPRFDPRHHPIRDLYVDVRTFDPRRIAIEVWAAAGPIHSRPTVVVDFAPIDGTWVIAHATMDFVLRLGFLSYAGQGEFRTSDVRFPTSEPDWLFDQQALAAHLRERLAP